MATRATYRFINNRTATDVCVYIHWDGYPRGAAMYLEKALIHATDNKRTLLASFIAANESAEITSSHEAHGDTDYRYDIDAKLLTVTVWRREGHWNNVTEEYTESWHHEVTTKLANFIGERTAA